MGNGVELGRGGGSEVVGSRVKSGSGVAVGIKVGVDVAGVAVGVGVRVYVAVAVKTGVDRSGKMPGGAVVARRGSVRSAQFKGAQFTSQRLS
jgi:hypothetical protein